MKLLTKSIERQLLKNWPDEEGLCQPALKLFNPCGVATWLITCMDPDYPDHLFGLCDLGFGFPEMGLVSLSEIQAVRGPLGLGIERDMYFTADFSIKVYVEAARFHGEITFTREHLEAAADKLGLS
tara:strand:- start:3935 stop:4312 length:378 start_codon:yes stop_codon:yes gene_type:complete